MNRHCYLQEMLASQRRTDLLGEAADARLAKLVQTDSRRDSALHGLLSWFGKLTWPHFPVRRGNREVPGRQAIG
jgi:hypothetical protein